MARGNPWFASVSGKLGETVFTQTKGQQTLRGYVAHPSNPKTRSQLNQRTQLSNLMAGYRLLNRYIAKGVENKNSLWSDCNAFTSLNLNCVKVYLPKEFAKEGGFVVAPYKLTKGALEKIDVWESDNRSYVTSVVLPADFTFTEETTVGEFSAALTTQSHTVWKENDQLSVVWLIQKVNAQTGCPTAKGHFYEVTLQAASRKRLFDVFPEMFCVNAGGLLATKSDMAVGGLAYIRTRMDDKGRMQVSTSEITLTGGDDIYKQFTGGTAATRAGDSYHCRPDALLRPSPDSGDTPETPPTAQITGLTVDGVNVFSSADAGSLSAGMPIAITGRGLEEALIQVRLNGSSTNVSLDTWLTNITRSANSVAGTTKNAQWLSALYLNGVLVRQWQDPDYDPTA